MINGDYQNNIRFADGIVLHNIKPKQRVLHLSDNKERALKESVQKWKTRNETRA